MRPVDFNGVNCIYGENQTEYLPLPVMRTPEGECFSCWELTDEEVEEVIRTRRVYVSQLTGFYQTPEGLLPGPIHPLRLMTNLADGIYLT